MTKDKDQNIEQETKPAPKSTVADKIWADLKNAQIDIFGLPGQIVSQYCQPMIVDPNKLHLMFKIGAVLPALEEAFSKKYNFQLADKFIVVSLKDK